MGDPGGVTIREAVEQDAAGVCSVFREAYGDDYSYPEFYETSFVKRLILGDDALMFVATDAADGRVLGTASVLLEIGALSDLLGEFGRLAVVPDSRGRHIGSMLMQARLAATRERLHVGIVDARVAHPYSLIIAQRHGFAVAGFSPLRHRFDQRESTCLLARWFGDALSLRRNNPRIIPEARALASMSLQAASLPVDVIIDDTTEAYPHESGFRLEELTTTGYSGLLRIERGRLRNREVFGPMRLHYGFFKLRRSHAQYLIARDSGHIAGAVGLIHDEHDRAIRVFELIAPDDHAVHFLLRELDRKCQEDWDIDLIEIDTRATAPRLQRTLLELGFVPSAYIPAMVFHDVERYDVVRMLRLYIPPKLGHTELTPEAEAVKDAVMRPLVERHASPVVKEALSRVDLLRSLAPEQAQLLAAACQHTRHEAGDELFREGQPADQLLMIVEGSVEIRRRGGVAPIGTVLAGESLGEMGLLEQSPHSATALAQTDVTALTISRDDLRALMRRRPDIGQVVYRRLAEGLAKKLRRTGAEGRDAPPPA